MATKSFSRDIIVSSGRAIKLLKDSLTKVQINVSVELLLRLKVVSIYQILKCKIYCEIINLESRCLLSHESYTHSERHWKIFLLDESIKQGLVSSDKVTKSKTIIADGSELSVSQYLSGRNDLKKVKKIAEARLLSFMSNFSCSKNQDVQNFLTTEMCISFEKGIAQEPTLF